MKSKREAEQRAVAAAALKQLATGYEFTGPELFGDEWTSPRGRAAWASKLMRRMVRDGLLTQRNYPGERHTLYSAAPNVLDRFLESPQELAGLIWPSERVAVPGIAPQTDAPQTLSKRVRFGDRRRASKEHSFDRTFTYIAGSSKPPPQAHGILVYVSSLDVVDQVHEHLRERIGKACRAGRAIELRDKLEEEGLDLTGFEGDTSDETSSAPAPSDEFDVDYTDDAGDEPNDDDEGEEAGDDASEKEILEGILHIVSATAENMIYFRDRIDELHRKIDALVSGVEELQKAWE